MFNFKYKHLKNCTGCYYYNRWSILEMQNMITGMIESGNEKDAYKTCMIERWNELLMKTGMSERKKDKDAYSQFKPG